MKRNPKRRSYLKSVSLDLSRFSRLYRTDSLKWELIPPLIKRMYNAVNFPVDTNKAAEAYGRLLEQEGGRADHLRLAKLIYLADRKSLVERDVPIVGGTYLSLRKGPMISEMTNFANRLNAPRWKEHISPRYGNEIRLIKKFDYSELSEAELEILDAVVEEHRNKTTEELTQWCHENCGEYENVIWTRKPISVEKLLVAEKKTNQKIAEIVQRAKADLELDALISAL